MRFLVDADLPRRTVRLLQEKGHEAFDVRTVLAPDAPDHLIAAYARTENLCLLSGDFGFADIRNYPPEQYAGIVVLDLPQDAPGPVILKLVAAFIDQRELLPRLHGRLAIVAFGRVRLRPA
jgi:MinD-like ATPase involved in chromosome partitioning or flagellar assembly